MELTHSFTVPASPQVTWDHFMDIGGVAECFPGAAVTSLDEEGFKGTVKVKLGPIALQYAGSGTFVERDDEAHTATLQANGKDKRGNGTAGATVHIALAEDGSGTAVQVTTDLAITGKPAQFGRGVMQDVSDKLLGQFVACLEQRLAEQPGGDDASGTDAAAGDEAGEQPAETPGAVDGAEAAEAASDAAAASAQVASDTEGAASATTATSAGAPAAGASAAGTSSSAPTPAPTRPAAHGATSTRASAPHTASTGSSDDALDLGATVLPVLLKSYAPQLVAAVVGFVLGVLVGRRRSG